MYGMAGVTVEPRPVQTRQIGLRFTENDYLRFEQAAHARRMRRATLAQRLILEWLDALDSAQDGD